MLICVNIFKDNIVFFIYCLIILSFLCAGSYTPLQAVQIHLREGNSHVCILQEVGLFQVNLVIIF